MPVTGPELFTALTGGAPGAPAVLTGDGATVARGGLAAWTDPWARALDRPRKALIVCFAGRSAATVQCWLAALRLGHAVAMFDAAAPAAVRDRFLAAYRPDLIAWCPDDGRLPGAPPAGYHAVDQPVPAAALWQRDDPSPVQPHPDLALVLSTSGSTGSPKAVRLSYANLAANSAAVAASLDVTPADRAVTSLPLHFGYGLSVLSSHLVAGGSVAVIPDRPTGLAFWRRFARAGCTGFAGVAPTYELLSRMLTDLDRVPGLRVMTCSGSRLRGELVVRFADWLARRGGRLYMMYGQTESTSRIACLPPRHLGDRLGSVGTAIPGGRISIEGGAQTAGDGRSGEIVYQGPNVMLGYAEDRADLALGDTNGGVLHTGDLGYLDDGFLYLTGRSKRIAKVLGVRISLDDVEWLFEDAGTVAVVDGGDRLVVFTDGPAEPVEQARVPVAAKLGIPATLLTVRAIPALPRTPNGKLDYRSLAID
ncbi:AMP-binding protein [Dactylosporangium sp. NPDC050688]|uniref:AMP-binding protein n=1 Tax=Dactylosporangium sp. NPDC050688 TaxID=3157217 RepID=UPI003404F1DA